MILIQRATLLLLLASAATVLRAQPQHIASLPGRPGKAGFALDISMESVGGSGYHPVYLEFNALRGTFAAQRDITISMGPRNEYRNVGDANFLHTIRVPQGIKRHRATVYLPAYTHWDHVQLSISEDGKTIETGSTIVSLGNLRLKDLNQNVSIGIMRPRDESLATEPWHTYPDLRSFGPIFGEGPLPEDIKQKRLKHKDAVAFAEQSQNSWLQFRRIEEARLHASWLGYSQLDIIIVPAAVLRRIEEEQPEAASALEDWIAQGGNLWIYGTNTKDINVLSRCQLSGVQNANVMSEKQLSRRLKLKEKNDTSQLEYDGYSRVYKESQNYAYSRNQGKKQATRIDIYKKLLANKNPITSTIPPNAVAKKLQFAAFGTGTILVIDDDDPFPGSLQLWDAINRTYTQKAQIAGPSPVSPSLHWNSRYGVDPSADNDLYWSMLIGAVGQPPVKSFVFLNACFVILLGPICYFVFRRRERLYLLFFFAPALALIMTLGLFLYALIADGWTARTRARQVTWIDASAGQMVTHTRAMYFTVLGSSQGLRFDREAAVFPLRYSNLQRYDGRSQTRQANSRIRYSDDAQKLEGAFIPPRNQVQFVNWSPRRIEKGLEFDFASSPATVTNHTPFQFKQLVARDSSGTHWVSSGIGPGQPAQLDERANPPGGFPVEPIVISKHVPDLSYSYSYYSSEGRSRIFQGVSASHLEDKVDQWNRSVANGRLPNGSFIGVADVDRSQLGLKDALLSESEHLVAGTIK